MFVGVALGRGEAHCHCLWVLSSGVAKQGEDSPSCCLWVWSSGEVNRSEDTPSRYVVLPAFRRGSDVVYPSTSTVSRVSVHFSV